MDFLDISGTTAWFVCFQWHNGVDFYRIIDINDISGTNGLVNYTIKYYDNMFYVCYKTTRSHLLVIIINIRDQSSTVEQYICTAISVSTMCVPKKKNEIPKVPQGLRKKTHEGQDRDPVPWS